MQYAWVPKPGGILGVNTPHFLGGLRKMGVREGAQQKMRGVEKNLGGKKFLEDA